MAKTTKQQTEDVIRNITGIYGKRVFQLTAISKHFAALAINYFRSEQLTKIDGRWWTNNTYQAAQRFFSDSFKRRGAVGWFVSHGVDYGVYLSLANNRQNDALQPIIKQFAGRFFANAQKLYKD